MGGKPRDKRGFLLYAGEIIVDWTWRCERAMGRSGFQNYHVTAEQGGLALAPFLRLAIEGLSWSKAKGLVEKRHVQIHGNLCTDAARKLKAGDVVKVWDEPLASPPKAEQLTIRYCDRHVVVVEKPAGVTTMRHSEEQNWSDRRRQLQPTLDEMLQRMLARKAGQGRGHAKGGHGTGRASGGGVRVRPVHRLDRDTSGLLVFALSVQAEQRLVQMFRKHDVERVYWAIAQGDVAEQTFESSLVRDRGDGRRGSTRLPDAGKHAITHVRPLERLCGYTLIECRLETGRTHQIRIHLSEAGHPICGERVYNKRLFGDEMPDRSGAARQALHAAVLGFAHPITNEPMRFEMALPLDMQRLLIKLRA